MSKKKSKKKKKVKTKRSIFRIFGSSSGKNDFDDSLTENISSDGENEEDIGAILDDSESESEEEKMEEKPLKTQNVVTIPVRKKMPSRKAPVLAPNLSEPNSNMNLAVVNNGGGSPIMSSPPRNPPENPMKNRPSRAAPGIVQQTGSPNKVVNPSTPGRRKAPPSVPDRPNQPKRLAPQQPIMMFGGVMTPEMLRQRINKKKNVQNPRAEPSPPSNIIINVAVEEKPVFAEEPVMLMQKNENPLNRVLMMDIRNSEETRDSIGSTLSDIDGLDELLDDDLDNNTGEEEEENLEEEEPLQEEMLLEEEEILILDGLGEEQLPDEDSSEEQIVEFKQNEKELLYIPDIEEDEELLLEKKIMTKSIEEQIEEIKKKQLSSSSKKHVMAGKKPKKRPPPPPGSRPPPPPGKK